MFRPLLVALVLGTASVASAAAPEPDAVAPSHGPACGPALRHVSMLAQAQMCPRPLATTIIAPPRHGMLHT